MQYNMSGTSGGNHLIAVGTAYIVAAEVEIHAQTMAALELGLAAQSSGIQGRRLRWKSSDSDREGENMKELGELNEQHDRCS